MRYPFIYGGLSGYHGATYMSLVIDGDSRSAGDYNGPQWWQLMRARKYKGSTNIFYADKASGGQTLTQMAADVVTTVGAVNHNSILPYGRRVLVVWGGVNDMRTDHVSGATAFSRLQTYLQTISAKKIYHEIIVLLQIPTATKDGIALNADLETFNSTITTNWGNDGASDIRASGATAYIDLPALYPGIFDDFTDYTGSFKNTDYYEDEVHLSAAGKLLIMDAVYDKLESLNLTRLPFRAEGVCGWLQWNKGLTYGSGTYVAQWEDILTHRRFSQGTEAVQPTYDSSGQQLDFNDDTLYLQNTYKGRNIFQNVAGMGFSANITPDVLADDDWLFQFSTGPSSSNYRLGLRLQSGANQFIQVRIRAADADSGTAVQGGTYEAEERFNVTAYVDVNDIATTGAYLKKNGTLIQTINSGYTGGSGVKTSDTASNRATFGAVGTSSYFNGKVNEVIFFDARHEPYIAETETYMINRPWLSA